MTGGICYHERMMTLLSVQGQGFLYSVLLFLFIFVMVHAGRLAMIGYRTLGKKLPPEPPQKPEPKPEPVYYLVEKKKKRAKSQYGEPKEISFR